MMQRLYKRYLPILLLATLTNACLFTPPETEPPPGYVGTLAAATWSAMQDPQSPSETPAPVFGQQGSGGPTATLPKASTATPRPTATFDPNAPTQTSPPEDLMGTAAAGVEMLLTGAPTLLPYLTEALEDPVHMTAEAVDSELEEAAEVGALAPDFSLVDANTGQAVRLSSLRGQPVLINFWAIWCTYCEDEMPAIQKAYDKYRDQGFVVLAVDVEESRNSVRNYGERLNLSFNLLLDSDGKVASRYLIYTYPTTYFVARDGVITNIIIGAIKKYQIEWYVSAIVE